MLTNSSINNVLNVPIIGNQNVKNEVYAVYRYTSKPHSWARYSVNHGYYWRLKGCITRCWTPAPPGGGDMRRHKWQISAVSTLRMCKPMCGGVFSTFFFFCFTALLPTSKELFRCPLSRYLLFKKAKVVKPYLQSGLNPPGCGETSQRFDFHFRKL